MKIGDLVRIKNEHIDEDYLKDLAWDSYWTGNPTPPPEDKWIGLVMDYLLEDGKIVDNMIYIQWTWSGRTVLEYTEHLEVVCDN